MTNFKTSVTEKLQNSPEWEISTKMINLIVEEANKMQIKLTEKEKDSLRSMRILATLYNDKKLYEEFRNDCYNYLQNK